MNNQILVQPKIYEDKIVLEIPKKILEGILNYQIKRQSKIFKTTNWLEIRKLKGVWKNARINPLKYEKNIRVEWDRKLDI
ncbi:MAG: hypothetical protein AAB732_02525 [Patescibacteria group bacterium]